MKRVNHIEARRVLTLVQFQGIVLEYIPTP